MIWLNSKQKELEAKILNDVDLDLAWKNLVWLSENVPQRLGGTVEEKKTVEYFQNEMKKFGTPCTIYEFDGYVGIPKKATLRVTFPEDKTIECIPLGMSPLEKGMHGKLVDAGYGTIEESKEAGVKGNVSLVILGGKPGDTFISRPEKVEIANKLGAIALILIQEMGKDFQWGQAKWVRGNPSLNQLDQLNRIPALTVKINEGTYLKELCNKGVVQVYLEADSKTGFTKIVQPIAELTGSVEPDKFVLTGAHQDAWGGGATDNGTGMVLVMELARLLTKYQKELRRGIRFSIWSSHECGLMAGSTWYVDNFWEDLNQNLVAYLNSDSPGIKADYWRSRNSPDIRKFHESNYHELGIKYDIKSTFHQRGGDTPAFLYGMGIPALDDVCRFDRREDLWWWHSVSDTIDKADSEVLEYAIKLQLLTAIRLCNCPILPFEYVTTANSFLKELEHLQDISGTYFNIIDLIDEAEKLKKAAITLEEEIKNLMSHFETASDSNKEKFNKTFDKINKKLMKTSRILNLAYHSKGGKYKHDNYGYYMSKPLPTLQTMAELPNLNPQSENFKAIKTGLVRQRNRISDSLKEATKILNSAIKEAKSI